MILDMSASGIVDIASHHSVDATVERVRDILDARGVRLFALVDHSGEAEKAGMKMRPTKLLIFGSPKAGTPVMVAAPSIAIDLPLKILVWEDADGKVWISRTRGARCGIATSGSSSAGRRISLIGTWMTRIATVAGLPAHRVGAAAGHGQLCRADSHVSLCAPSPACGLTG
jgi:uncharacterized protein (DUF302 family)